MAERIRFHLDEHVDPDVARALRQHRIDVSTTVEAGLRMASDTDQLDYARREGRVLVTHDADFCAWPLTALTIQALPIATKRRDPLGKSSAA